MATEQDEMKKALRELFDAACGYNGFSSTRTFSNAEREKFLDQLVEMIGKSLQLADPHWLTWRLLKTEGKFESVQDRAEAILKG